MKITVFTSNQARHLSLIEDLATIASEVFAVQECITVFPGKVADFYKRTEIMQEYFSHVINAEETVFGSPRFLPSNVRTLSLKAGDLTKLNMEYLNPALQSDYYIVFGSSFIKGDLMAFLEEKRAINIHMGISPYYRGNSCNFWALYDKKPDLVGATIHLLSKGLDSGNMLFHALPKAAEVDPFVLGMQAVKAAHQGLIATLQNGEIFKLKSVVQNKTKEIRYTRNQDFTDEVAQDYLRNAMSPVEILQALQKRDLSVFHQPYVLT